MGSEPLGDVYLISQLKARYMRLVDEKRWSELVELFVADFAFEGNWTSRGGAAFVERVRASLDEANTVHELHAPEIEIHAAGAATAIWPFADLIDERRDGVGLERRGFGHYHERYAKVGSAWLISAMRVTRVRVECAVFLRGGGVRRETCRSQEEFAAWLARYREGVVAPS